MTQMYMIWNIFNLRKCLRRKGKVIAAYQELAVWCKIGGGGERIGGGRHGKGGGEDRIGGGGGRWPPKLMNCTAQLAFPLSGKWIAWNHLFCQSIQIEQSLKCMCLLEFKTLQFTRTERDIFPNFALNGGASLLCCCHRPDSYIFANKVSLKIVVLCCCVAVLRFSQIFFQTRFCSKQWCWCSS